MSVESVLVRVTYVLRLNEADQKLLLPLLPESVLTQDDYEERLAEALVEHLPDLLDRAINEPECEAL